MTGTRRYCRAIILAAVLAGFLALVHPGVAGTLADYRSKVEKARTMAIETEQLLKNNEEDRTRTRAFIDYVRANFSPSERVEWNGGTVDVTSEWLLERIGALENGTDLKTRIPIAVEMREYLSSVLLKTQELEAASVSARSKDEDKQKLAEILRREEYQKPQAREETAFQRWIASFMEWIESFFQGPKQPATSSGFQGLGIIFTMLIYLGLFMVLAFVLYKIIPFLIPAARRVKASKKNERIILGEKIADDETSVDLLAEAERLAREGNLRGAIRKGYIALLCELSDRKVLGLARHKTNRDYLRDVRSRGELHPRMKVVTDTFERHWYGSQESVDQDWIKFRDDYESAVRSV